MDERKALSVTQVNLYIKEVISRDDILSDVLVKGELSNFKAHSSGHMYMSLKDETGVMRAVMFRSAAMGLNFKPQNGMKVVARGRISVYERDGQYQLYINDMQQEGQGDLYRAFEQLKIKLSAEGLFDPAHKMPLPKYPKKVGVVTAPTGAAIRDIINVLSRRFSYADIVLYPVLVQGENSAQSIVEAIKYFNENKIADVLIVGRGGGSIEDLWSFNEEIVARAIYESCVPIVSAVGHEIDFTIADFVADLRAPTPSAAAELVVPSQIELSEKFNNVYRRIFQRSMHIVEKGRMSLKSLEDRTVFKEPIRAIDDERQNLDNIFHNFELACKNAMSEKRQRLIKNVASLDGLSPLGTLTRGYSVTTDEDGKVIKSVNQIKKNDTVKVRVTDGEFNATVI